MKKPSKELTQFNSGGGKLFNKIILTFVGRKPKDA
jgi:hypothetical protein